MLETFRGEVYVNKEQQEKRNKLMRDRLTIQFAVMEKLGFTLDNEGFLNWEKSNAKKFEQSFESKAGNQTELDVNKLSDEIAEEMGKETVH